MEDTKKLILEKLQLILSVISEVSNANLDKEASEAALNLAKVYDIMNSQF